MPLFCKGAAGREINKRKKGGGRKIKKKRKKNLCSDEGRAMTGIVTAPQTSP